MFMMMIWGRIFCHQAKQFLEDFKERVFSIVFTDSVHAFKRSEWPADVKQLIKEVNIFSLYAGRKREVLKGCPRFCRKYTESQMVPEMQMFCCCWNILAYLEVEVEFNIFSFLFPFMLTFSFDDWWFIWLSSHMWLLFIWLYSSELSTLLLAMFLSMFSLTLQTRRTAVLYLQVVCWFFTCLAWQSDKYLSISIQALGHQVVKSTEKLICLFPI